MAATVHTATEAQYMYMYMYIAVEWLALWDSTSWIRSCPAHTHNTCTHIQYVHVATTLKHKICSS